MGHSAGECPKILENGILTENWKEATIAFTPVQGRATLGSDPSGNGGLAREQRQRWRCFYCTTKAGKQNPVYLPALILSLYAVWTLAK